MHFEPALLSGTLIKRYKRFLADIELASGEVITAHCPNPGSMQSCKEPGWPVQVSFHNNPKRKLKYTFEMIHNGQTWIGVNTMRTNPLVKEALEQDLIPELTGYDKLRSEVKYGEKSRIDFLLEGPKQACYVEVKNVSLLKAGVYQFPDGVTERGRKHLYELLEMVKQGHRAVNLFVVQREDSDHFQPAADIDPAYAKALKEVSKQGVEILVYQAKISPKELTLSHALEWSLD